MEIALKESLKIFDKSSDDKEFHQIILDSKQKYEEVIFNLFQ